MNVSVSFSHPIVFPFDCILDSWFAFQEVVVGPENRTAVSSNSFLRVNLIGDFGGYTDIPSFEDFYLVIPREVCLHNYGSVLFDLF